MTLKSLFKSFIFSLLQPYRCDFFPAIAPHSHFSIIQSALGSRLRWDDASTGAGKSLPNEIASVMYRAAKMTLKALETARCYH